MEFLENLQIAAEQNTFNELHLALDGISKFYLPRDNPQVKAMLSVIFRHFIGTKAQVRAEEKVEGEEKLEEAEAEARLLTSIRAASKLGYYDQEFAGGFLVTLFRKIDNFYSANEEQARAKEATVSQILYYLAIIEHNLKTTEAPKHLKKECKLVANTLFKIFKPTVIRDIQPKLTDQSTNNFYCAALQFNQKEHAQLLEPRMKIISDAMNVGEKQLDPDSPQADLTRLLDKYFSAQHVVRIEYSVGPGAPPGDACLFPQAPGAAKVPLVQGDGAKHFYFGTTTQIPKDLFIQSLQERHAKVVRVNFREWFLKSEVEKIRLISDGFKKAGLNPEAFRLKGNGNGNWMYVNGGVAAAAAVAGPKLAPMVRSPGWV